MSTLATLVGGAGVILILVGLVGGGFTFSGTVVPAVGKIARVLCFAVGGVMLPVGIFLAFTPVGPDPVPSPQPQPGPTTEPGPPPSSTAPVVPYTPPERSAPGAERWSTSEIDFFYALDADGINYLAYGTKQETADLAWTMCDSFSAGVTLEEMSGILVQTYDVDTTAAIQTYGVLHLCPENEYVFG